MRRIAVQGPPRDVAPEGLAAETPVQTLHDAVVRKLRVGFAERELTLVVDYSDLVPGRESEPNTRTRVTMRWFGITESMLRLHNNDELIELILS